MIHSKTQNQLLKAGSLIGKANLKKYIPGLVPGGLFSSSDSNSLNLTDTGKKYKVFIISKSYESKTFHLLQSGH